LTTPAKGNRAPGIRRLEVLRQDLHYAFRMLRRSPGFTLVALLSLGFGIGTNTAIFSLIDSLLLQSLPVAHAERLLIVSHRGTQPDDGGDILFSYRAFRQLMQSGRVCRGVFAFTSDFTAVVRPVTTGSVGASGSEIQETAEAQLVSGNFFSALEVKPQLGRTFAPDEDQPPLGHSVAILSDGYWKRRFAQDPQVIGKTVLVNNTPLTVVGVLPPDFFGVIVTSSPDVYMPLTLREAIHYSGNTNVDGPDRPGPIWAQPHNHWLEVMARRQPGVDAAQAQAALGALYHQDLQDEVTDLTDPKDRADALGRHLIVDSGANGLSDLRDSLAKPLFILLCLAGFVLLIACANVANLLLARADKRRKEMAVRLGIGAGRGRLIRQLLTESLLLAGLGGVLGLLFGVWGSRFLYTLIARPRVPLQLASSLDFHKLLTAVLIAAATGLLFGLAPALLSTRLDLATVLKDASRSVASGKGGGPGRRLPLGRILVAAQIALSLVLLVGAGLFIRSLRNLMEVPLGFERQGLIMVEINPRILGLSDQRQLELYRRIQERVATVPGVRAVSLSLTGLFSNRLRTSDLAVPGFDEHSSRPGYLITDECLVTPGYFETTGIAILQGRSLQDRDRENAPKVAVISASMAKRFWPNGDAVGKRFGFGDGQHAHENEVVGIARDAKYNSLSEKTQIMVYRPVYQAPTILRFVIVRTSAAQMTGVASQMRRVLAEVNPALPVFDVTTMEQQLDRSLARTRAVARLTGFFSTLALLLAAIGLYGVMSYAVARRTSEIGVRMALGAPRANVLRLILRETVELIGIGLAAGVVAALFLSRLAASQLFELRANDPLTIVFATLGMGLVAFLAGYIPARRASRTDPMEALRYE
jgi:predicted permease